MAVKAAPKPSFRRRPAKEVDDFIEGAKPTVSKKAKVRKAGSAKPNPKPKVVPKKAKGRGTKATRVAKRLYIPEDLDKKLRLRAAAEGREQSEIATEALEAYL